MAIRIPMAFTPAQVLGLKQRLSLTPPEVIQFLESSEYDLILTMVADQCWTGPVPPPPATTVKGEASFGLVPYLIQKPGQDLLAAIDSLPAWVQDVVEGLLKTLQQSVPTRMNDQNYANLVDRVTKKGGLVGADGSVYGFGTYECLDFNWLWAVFDHLYTRAIGNDPYVFAPPPPIALDDRGSGRLTIALVSDWGTGPFALGTDSQGPALDVMEQLTKLSPDYVIHLGDVYYSGTPNSDDIKDLLYFPWHEEQDNFLNYWPTTSALAAGRSFALNSNHEMYSGGQGYFKVALGDGRFSGQTNTATGRPSSAFALSYAGWTFLALDSAYYDPSPMCMVGSLGGAANPQQAAWIRSLFQSGAIDPARCVVLSHHAPISYDGSALETYTDAGGNAYGLWPELTSALGGAAPACWYYGHIHNGIVYNPGKNATGSTSRLRCLGNGALPYGNAWGLAGNPGGAIAYYYQTPNPSDPNGVLIYNGFVLLTVSADGTLQEALYQQGPPGGAPTIVFSSTIAGP